MLYVNISLVYQILLLFLRLFLFVRDAVVFRPGAWAVASVHRTLHAARRTHLSSSSPPSPFGVHTSRCARRASSLEHPKERVREMYARVKVRKALCAADAVERDAEHFKVVYQLLLENVCNAHLGRGRRRGHGLDE